MSVCLRWHAISMLLAQNPKLIDFVFNEKRDRLAQPALMLRREARAFSTGEKVLIQIALDIWDDCGGARLSEVIFSLDPIRLELFLRAVEILRFSRSSSDSAQHIG